EPFVLEHHPAAAPAGHALDRGRPDLLGARGNGDELLAGHEDTRLGRKSPWLVGLPGDRDAPFDERYAQPLSREIDVEDGAERGDRPAAGRDDERSIRIVRHVEQRLPSQKSDPSYTSFE